MTAFALQLPATLASVTALQDALEAWAEDADIPNAAAMRLALVAEELAANVASHAAGASFFRLEATPRPGGLDVAFTDDGPAYDPLASAAPDTAAPLEERDPGGLGVHLVKQMTVGARHSREAGLNRLTCTLPLPG
ncbi:ATP-binding protein [Roseococcus sp. DSY-14]|uniref:ATP-binding protein n=1 Tax=Roseococcus sp. DSY-14 TaxID=3369650 RepID=UPI00387A8ACE